MALLGSSVDPRLFMQDYSGFTRAAEIQAQGMQNLGASIGGAIESYAEAKEKRKKVDASTKASRAGIESAIKLGEAYGIDVKSSLEPILAKMDDPNTTPMEAAMYGEEAKNRITNVLNMGITASERESAQQRAMMEQQYKAAQLGLQAEKVDIARQQAAKGPAPKFEIRRPTITSPDGKVFEGPELPYDESRGMFFDTKAQKYIADPNLIGTGKEYAPDSAMPTPTSQVGSSAADLIASAAEMNIGKLNTAKTPGTQGGNVGCADAICRTFKQATGEELVPGGTLSTREMATTLENDPRFVKVPLGQAQKGDIVLTPRKGNKAGHTGIVLDGGAIASNSSKGFAGKAPGTFVQNYTIDSWKRSVAPRNPSETAAYRYVGPQGIDNALAIGGDMTQQAMGTPQQQAMLSQQIEQGAGLATAQNIPQGAMPTEPSMVTQQPQLPQQAAPQWTPPPGFTPKRGKFRDATAEEIARYGTQGQVNLETGEFRPIRPPSGMVIEQTPGGGFRVVQGAGVADRREEAAQAAKEQGISRAKIGTQDINRALDVLDSGVMKGSGPLASFYRAGAANFVKGTPEYTLAKSFIEPIKAMVAFGELSKMRLASPTGGALGNVAKFETDMLQQTAGQLDIDKTDPKTLRANLIRLQEQYLDVVHGTREQRRKLWDEGKITEEQYFEIESQYPAFTMSMTGRTVPRQIEGIAPEAQKTEAEKILDELGE